MNNNEKCILLLNRTNKAIKDCVSMLNNLEQLGANVDNDVLEQIRLIHYKTFNLMRTIDTELESLNEND